MSVDMNNLLTLPSGERRKIAERLWNSLSPVNSLSKEDEETISSWKKDGKICKMVSLKYFPLLK